MDRISKICTTNEEIQKTIQSLNSEVIALETDKYETQLIAQLSRENKELEECIDICVKQLTSLQKRAKKETRVLDQISDCLAINNAESDLKSSDASKDSKNQKTVKEKSNKSKQIKPIVTENDKKASTEANVDVGRLDLKVGKIVEVKKHPDADGLYVSQVDVGVPSPLTVISGLVKHVPLADMKDRVVVLLCNLKPVKMRGILSEAMIMCASTPEKVEILSPPPGSSPGDIVLVTGYQNNPDPVLNPKKKIFETVAVDLLTDSDCIATYKGAKWFIEGKGMVKAQSLVNVNIK